MTATRRAEALADEAVLGGQGNTVSSAYYSVLGGLGNGAPAAYRGARFINMGEFDGPGNRAELRVGPDGRLAMVSYFPLEPVVARVERLSGWDAADLLACVVLACLLPLLFILMVRRLRSGIVIVPASLKDLP